MAKAIVYAKDGVLQGVFTNKKNLWRDLEDTCGDVSELMVKLGTRKPVSLTYSKLSKLLGERKMLRIYSKDDIKEAIKEGSLEKCVSAYKLWEVEMNKHYTAEWLEEKEEDGKRENTERYEKQ